MEYVDSVVMIPKTLAHSYDVTYDGKRILIDAGTKGSGRKIIQYYERLHAKPEIVLITHYHPDHIGGLSQIMERFNPHVYVPEGEMEVISGKRKMIPASSFISRLIARTSKIDKKDGLLPLGKFNLNGVRVIPTNGHTPDSRSFLFENLKCIFVGDAMYIKKGDIIFNKKFTIFPDKARASIEKIKSYHGYTVYPGHGNTFKLP